LTIHHQFQYLAMKISAVTRLMVLSAALIMTTFAGAESRGDRAEMTIRILDPYGKPHANVPVEGYFMRREIKKGRFFNDIKNHAENFSCTSDEAGQCKFDAPLHSGDHVEGHISKIGLPEIVKPFVEIYVSHKNPGPAILSLTLFVEGSNIRTKSNPTATTAAQVQSALTPTPSSTPELIVFDTSSVHALWNSSPREQHESSISISAVGDRTTKTWTFYVDSTNVEDGPFNMFDGAMALAGKQTTRDVTYKIKEAKLKATGNTYRRRDSDSKGINWEAVKVSIPESHLRDAVENYAEGTAAALIVTFEGRKFLHHKPLHLFEIEGLLRKVAEHKFE
jgi:hypothetical protein